MLLDNTVFDKGECVKQDKEGNISVVKSGLYQLAFNAAGNNLCSGGKSGLGLYVNGKCVNGARVFFDGTDEDAGLAHTLILQLKENDVLKLVNLIKSTTAQAALTMLRIADSE